MGNTQNAHHNIMRKSEEWQKTDLDPYYRHVNDGDIAYTISLKNVEYMQFTSFAYRQKHNTYLPNVKGIIEQTNINQNSLQILNCSSQKSYLILFEPIFYTLSDLGSLCFADAIYILSICLKGGELLYKEYGYFYIHEDMIGFTQNGRCKIWKSPKFYSSQLKSKNNILEINKIIEAKSQLSEPELVSQILGLIEERIQPSPQYNRYSQMKSQNLQRSVNFSEINKFLSHQLEINSISVNNYQIQMPIHEDIQAINKARKKNPSNKKQNSSKMSLKPYHARCQSKVIIKNPEKQRLVENQMRNPQSTIRFEYSQHPEFRRRNSLDKVQRPRIASPEKLQNHMAPFHEAKTRKIGLIHPF